MNLLTSRKKTCGKEEHIGLSVQKIDLSVEKCEFSVKKLEFLSKNGLSAKNVCLLQFCEKGMGNDNGVCEHVGVGYKI